MKITIQGATADALQDDLIGDLVPPRDPTNTAKAPHVIAVKFCLLPHVCWPSFEPVKKIS